MKDIQKNKIIHFFNVLDHDGNGILEQEDFELVSEAICDLRGLEKNATERLNLGIKAHGIFVQVLKDLNKDTAIIRREEWVKFFDNEILAKSQEYVNNVCSYLFSIFDQDGDGFIDEEEYLDMFRAYGLYTAQAKKAFDLLDLNGDGKISEQELIKAFTDFFYATDEKAAGNWIFGDWRNKIEAEA
ncbi:MAG: EF-hand domain-containing protein [Bacteroidota bacterium]